MNVHLGTVAGEPSGDLLMARVLQGLSAQLAEPRYEGIGGPAMVKQGLNCWHDMQALSVFGYVDALKRLPQLLSIYTQVKRRWLAQPPQVFVGVDAPDFNLRLELALRKAGIPTVHFVSPSIWAWRYERIEKIRQAVSHMLVLFPFEEALYQEEGVPATYVGHPLAQQIPLQPDQKASRAALGLNLDDPILALLPGSRLSEIKLLAPRFLETVKILQRREPSLKIVVPMVNQSVRSEFDRLLAKQSVANLTVLQQDPAADRPVSWDALQACDAVLAASGTATLEAALFKRPMVISYVLSPAMRHLMAWRSGQKKPLTPWVGLPNILLNDFVVPELLQEEAQPENLANACWRALFDTEYVKQTVAQFYDLHKSLSRDTARLAADVILEIAQR